MRDEGEPRARELSRSHSRSRDRDRDSRKAEKKDKKHKKHRKKSKSHKRSRSSSSSASRRSRSPSRSPKRQRPSSPPRRGRRFLSCPVSCWPASALLHTCTTAPSRLFQRDPDLVRNPSPDPWSLEAPPPSADQQQRILMERAAARAQSARSLPFGFGTVPHCLPSGFGARAQAAPPSQGNAYQRGVIRCAACLVDRYPLRLCDYVCSSHSADPRVEHSR